MTALNAQQMTILKYHADTGDRIAYYSLLAEFGVEYGRLALGVVLNSTLSGASANAFFLTQATEEGKVVTNDQLAEISLDLMQADFARREVLGGADLSVDDIQRYHREVF
jgi:hypothetical protein